MFSADGAEPKCTIVADVTLTPSLTSWFDPAYVIRSALRFHHVCRIAARKKFSFRFFLSVFFHRATICLFGRSQRVVFTARCYASAVLAMGLCLPVRVRVCPSVTSRSSTKTAKLRITQTTSHDTSGTLVFCRQRSSRNSTGVTPYGGAKCRWGGPATFDK